MHEKGFRSPKGYSQSQDECVWCTDGRAWRAQIEQKKRDKAKQAASKKERVKPLFEEDGKRRGLLDKYDEEEDTGMDIDESGAFTSEKARQQAEIRAKLAAGVLLPPCSYSGSLFFQF